MQICPSWLSFILYNPIRKALTDREKVLDRSGIAADSVVLEIGPGNGFLTEVIAEKSKKVTSVEVQEGMVRKLKKRVEHFGDKVEIVLADIASVQLPENVYDVALLYYSFHEIGEQKRAVKNIVRALKRGGIVSIYEPNVEVNKSAMAKTIELFIAEGVREEIREDGLFSRFVRLSKR